MVLAACFGSSGFSEQTGKRALQRWPEDAGAIPLTLPELHQTRGEPSSGLHWGMPWCCDALCGSLKEQGTSRLLFIDSRKKDHSNHDLLAYMGVPRRSLISFSSVILDFWRDNPPDIHLTEGMVRHSLIILVSCTFFYQNIWCCDSYVNEQIWGSWQSAH